MRRTSLRTRRNYLKIRRTKVFLTPDSGQVVPKSAIVAVLGLMGADLPVVGAACEWCFTAHANCGQILGQMINAFQQMGIARRLVVADDFLREAFLDFSKRVHPDAGGGEGEFTDLREALALLLSPASRLKLWMELRGTPAEVRGVIGAALMDVFAEVGRVTQGAESLIRKRDATKSALGRAMLENETQLKREEVEQMIAKVDGLIRVECEKFVVFEANEFFDHEAASVTVRNLTFLEKWRTGLRGCYSRLV